MKNLVKFFNILFIALLISSFGIIGHASATSSRSHSDASSKTTSSASCTAFCVNAPVNKDQDMPDLDEEDDTPPPPHYQQLTSAQTGWFAERRIVAQSIDVPDTIPKYRLCCVIQR